MKSLERRFNNISFKNPNLSSLACFYHAVDSQDFNQQTVHRWFYKLVEKTDYQRSDLKAILAELDRLSQSAEDNKKQGVIAPPKPLTFVSRRITRPQLQTALF